MAYATALLNEKEQSGSSNGSDGSPANENADRSLRQVGITQLLDESPCSSSSAGSHSYSPTEKNGPKMEHPSGFCQELYRQFVPSHGCY